LQTGRGWRWFSNLGLMVLDTAVTRAVFPVLPVAMATIASGRGWGMLNILDLPASVELVLAVVALDAAIYLQHVAFHYQPLLWRLHRMHHTDLDLDVTSGNRFHPLEILISIAIKLCVVVAVGAPPTAVLIFEIVLNACAMFNHGNISLPLPLDQFLRLLLVTPDMHRVHHSVIPSETNSNFGFCLPWWDRLFRTYRDQPEAGHAAMTIGLSEFREPARLMLHHLLMQPFITAPRKERDTAT
jgi:sterol desaturase/sphingolipid hydroxylase (fatty acid hydroxylase superfamily)